MKPPCDSRVVVAMSGGVDSSVAACLLHEQGYDVVGMFLRVGVEEPADATCPTAADGATPPSAYGTARAGGAVTTEGPTTATPARRSHQGCCSAADAADARFVAGLLGIPFFALNFQRPFARVIDYFADEYAAGRTPNPCIICNQDLKFGRLVEYADAVGARYIATGHYARILPAGRHGEQRAGRPVLCRGADPAKDQSYVLFGLDRAVLDRVLFPVGGYRKDEVRALAARFGLPVHDKPDSVEICFVPDGDYARVVQERRPEAFAEGDVVDASGRRLGRHGGVARYTIGQRRGLGIATGRPAYVTDINLADNTVTLGDRGDLLRDGLIATACNLLVDPAALHPEPRDPPLTRGAAPPRSRSDQLPRVKGSARADQSPEPRASARAAHSPEPQASACADQSPEPQASACADQSPEPQASARADQSPEPQASACAAVPAPAPRCLEFRADVKIRYLHRAAPSTVRLLPGDRFEVRFDEPQPAVTPGQAAVLYTGDVVLGGGWIETALPECSPARRGAAASCDS
jgi:tRNA-specific 2-thiouridylase